MIKIPRLTLTFKMKNQNGNFSYFLGYWPPPLAPWVKFWKLYKLANVARSLKFLPINHIKIVSMARIKEGASCFSATPYNVVSIIQSDISAII